MLQQGRIPQAAPPARVAPTGSSPRPRDRPCPFHSPQHDSHAENRFVEPSASLSNPQRPVKRQVRA